MAEANNVEAGAVRKTRKRKSHNCLPCRQRKKLCDRQVPGCSQCRQRGETHLCRWGDERDEAISPRPPLQRQRMDPPESRRPSSSLLDTLSTADAHPASQMSPFTNPSPAARNDVGPSSSRASVFSQTHTHRLEHDSEARSFPALSCDQARHLFYCYQENASKAMPLLDKEVVLDALDEAKTNKLAEIRQRTPDVYAVILTVCAAILIVLPPTLSISLGLISKSQDLGPLLDSWEKEAFDALEDMSMFSHPTLTGVHCLALHQLYLTHRVAGPLHVQRLDAFIRACRRLGLDQLGSPEDDERLWAEQDRRLISSAPALPSIDAGSWAASTFLRRESKARNQGRAVWSFAVAKDWVTSRLSGSCTIHPASYTTSIPALYSSALSGITKEDNIVWSHAMSASVISHKYFELSIRAEAYGNRLDYDKILEIDAELMADLDRRPDWLRPEKWNGMQPHFGNKIRAYEAILVSGTLYHRLFALHRPFLALSRSEPERYGISSSRSFHFATLCIRTMREGLQQNILMLKQLAFHYRILQAALVVITHLFLSNDLSMSETIVIHQDLNFAISAIKQLSVADDRGFFYGQGEKLETLIAISTKLKNQRPRDPNHSCLLRNRDQWRSLDQADTPDDLLPSNQEENFTTLDEQLLKLSQFWPIGTEQVDLDSIWDDIFSVLGTNVNP